ncbi:MAG: phosphotransferase [Dehalococcoidia bacterium]|nr:phosphotransferase [Dehalococcoidia bacterium]
MTAAGPSPNKIAEGREAEIFSWRDGTVLRLLRDPDGRARLEREAAAMQAARESGVPVPAVHGIETAFGRDGMVIDRVDGPDLLTEIGTRPWQLLRAARVTGDLQARLHEVPAPASLPGLRPVIGRRIAGAGLPAAAAAAALRMLDALPDGARLCHGDFHPGNIIDTRAGPMIIDWPNATRGDADADHARTLLLLTLGEPPPGAPLLVRYLTDSFRKLFAWRYRRAYLARRSASGLGPVDAGVLQRWFVVNAAARLAEGIDGERAKLRTIVDRGLVG